MAGSRWSTRPLSLGFSVLLSAIYAAENGFRSEIFIQRTVSMNCHDSQQGIQVSSPLVCALYCFSNPGCFLSTFDLDTHACTSSSRKPSARRNCSMDGAVTYIQSSGRTKPTGCNSDRSYTHEPRTGLCYKHYKTPLSWDKAQERCYKDGGDLVQGDTEAKLNHLQTVIGDEGLATFIGAFKRGSTCWWVDVSAAVNVNCERCRSCLMINMEGKLACEECGNPLSFICEVK